VEAEVEEELRRIRRERADWSFIHSLPPRQRAALQYYIETGDIRRAAKLAGLPLEDFRELMRRAKIPLAA
jgi:DNA-directed RNA polymerase specialized sigma24 family protein